MLTIILKASLVGGFAFVAALAVFLMMNPSGQPPQYKTNQSAANEPQDTAKDDDAGKTFRQRILIIWRNTTNDAVAFFTFWLAVFSCMLVIVAAFQVWLLLRAERISANVAQAAKDSADAANKAVILSDKTAERQLRAYVFIPHAEISDIVSDQKLTAKIAVKNFGQTPAYDVETSMRVEPTRFPLSITLPLAVQKTKTTNIGPGGEITITFSGGGPSAIEWRPLFTQKTGAVYVYGTIKYVDAFKIPRFTNFRFYKGGDLGVSGPELSFSADGKSQAP